MKDINILPKDKYIVISLPEEFAVYFFKDVLKTDTIIIFAEDSNLKDLRNEYPEGFFLKVGDTQRCILTRDQKSILMVEASDKKITTLLILYELAENAIADIYALIGEAKARAFFELDITQEFFSYNSILAIKKINAKKMDYGGIFKKLKDGMKDTLIMYKNMKFPMTILERLEERNIFLNDLVTAGMALYIGEESKKIEKKLEKELVDLSEDINVSSLILAGMKLEEECAYGRIKGLLCEEDPAFLYADEILGMAIANEIAGTKGIFNFKRYDEKKPGIISEQGIFMDDVLAGFVAGAMSKLLYPKGEFFV